jgi:hypothetical protein
LKIFISYIFFLNEGEGGRRRRRRRRRRRGKMKEYTFNKEI